MSVILETVFTILLAGETVTVTVTDSTDVKAGDIIAIAGFGRKGYGADEVRYLYEFGIETVESVDAEGIYYGKTSYLAVEDGCSVWVVTK